MRVDGRLGQRRIKGGSWDVGWSDSLMTKGLCCSQEN